MDRPQSYLVHLIRRRVILEHAAVEVGQQDLHLVIPDPSLLETDPARWRPITTVYEDVHVIDLTNVKDVFDKRSTPIYGR